MPARIFEMLLRVKLRYPPEAISQIIIDKKMKRAFTLIELIVVIIIVGILAAVGITQYSKTVERGRDAEAKMILGQMRQLAYEYYLQNGTITGITYADLGIGSASDQIPQYPTCRSSHYFTYWINAVNPLIYFQACRCTSGGKEPQSTGGFGSTNYIQLTVNPSTGQDTWLYVGR